MDLNTLASNLRTQAETKSTIVINAGVFEDDTVRKAIRRAFALPSDADLTISNVGASNIPEPAGGVLRIAAGKVSVLKQRDVPVSLTFTSPNGALQMIVAVEMRSDWKFADSFNGLDSFPFDLLEVSGATFVYTTLKQAKYAWPGEPSTTIDLAAGLNFLSHVTFKHLPTLQTLLKSVIGDWSVSRKFWGPFSPVDGEELPVGKLRAEIGSHTFTIGSDPIELKLGAPAIAIEIGAETEDLPLQPIDLVVQAEFQQALDVAIAIPVTGGGFEVDATPLPGISSEGVLNELPGVGAVKGYIPAELRQVFADIALDNFSLIVTPEMKVTYVGLSISTNKPWNVIPGTLELRDLSLKVETISPSDLNWTRVHIKARSKFLPEIFADDDFTFAVELEKAQSWQVTTISGAYHGSVKLQDIVKGIPGANIDVPQAISGIEFYDFGVSAIRTAQGFTYSFYGSAAAGFPILGTRLTSALSVAVTKTASGHTVHLGGGLMIGEQVFSMSLDLGGSTSQMVATWEHQGTPLGFGDIANAFGWTEMPQLPEGLDLGLKSATFTYDFKAKTIVLTAHSVNYGEIVFVSLLRNQKAVYCFALDMPLDLKFSNLPLVGESLPADPPVGVDELQLIVASEAFNEEQMADLNARIAGASQLMPKTLGKGLTLAAKLEMGGPHEVVLPLTDRPKSVHDTPVAELAPTDGGAPTSLTAPSYQAEPKWFELNKTLGPVRFEKVGVQYQASTLRFLLNAALSAAGLTLSVEGLSVGSSLTKFKPEFELRGLGVDYKAGDIEIGGAFLRTVKDGKPDSYDGAAVIKTKQFAVSAFGSYTKLNGEPSLFIYAFLDYPLGGPAFFFVTGLAAGFGYNRRLIAPSIDNVANFPLVKQAIQGRQVKPKDLTDALKSLQDYIPPGVGSIFLAVGVKFNSFKLIDSFALLTVEFGNNLAINLLGISKAVVPTPEAGKAVTPLAQVEIAWKATFNPDDGCLGIDARLTPNSYILSKDCRLSGGYAFYSWFSGPHAGDFVQTLGGYHPKFDVPAHYPKVPRLAFDWRVSNSLTIQGDAYYALTGSALMAGGHLEVLFKEGELRAWLKLGADFLIAWKPYHYDASIYVNVGASYTFDINLLFTRVRVTISVDVGAQLHLWGPDFSGTARIDLSVISFTIAFGAGASQAPEPLKAWSNFQQSFLPAPQDVCTISVKDGLVRNIEAQGVERWVINPKQFSLVIDSAIPIKSAPAVGGKLDNVANVKFGIGPMALSKEEFKTSNLTITIKNNTGAKVDGNFKHSLIKKLVPAGLWGETASPKLNGKQFLENVATGIEITPGNPPDAGQTEKIHLEQFKYAEERYPKALKWESASSFVPSADAEDSDRRKTIEDSVASNKRRDALMHELGVTFKINVRPQIAEDFLSAPQIGTL